MIQGLGIIVIDTPFGKFYPSADNADNFEKHNMQIIGTGVVGL